MARRLIPITAGVVLLLASVAKGLALAETNINPSKLSTDWLLSLTGSAFELFLGVWLVAGVFPRTVRVLTLITFLSFAAISLYKISIGAESCGCLGNIHLSPRYVFLFDLAVAFLVWWVAPPEAVLADFRSSALLLVGTLVLAGGLGVKVYQTATEMSRRVVVSEPFHEFGQVEQNRVLTHIFTLENRCPYPVEVVKTSSSCGCTTIDEIAGQEIPAGETLSIPVTLHTKEYDEHLVGRITLFCRRAGSSNAPGFFQDLVIAADVQPDYWVRPLIVDFGEIDHGGPVTRVVKLRPHRLQDVQITQVEASNPSFTARLLGDRTEEGDLQVEIGFSGRNLTASNSLSASVTFHTTSSKRKSIVVLAKASFRSPVSVEPSAIVIPRNISGEVVREVTIKLDRPGRIELGQSMSPRVHATVTEGADNRHRVQVKFLSETGQSGLSTELRCTVRFADATVAGEAWTVVVPLHRLPNPVK